MLWQSVRTAKGVSVVWFMNAYFSWFFLMMVNNGPYARSRGFTGEVITVTQTAINYLAIYAFEFNLLFLLSFAVVWALLRGGKCSEMWSASSGESSAKGAIATFALFLIVGSILYWIKMRGVGYRGYVEFQYQGSNWPAVFLWASAPLVCIFSMKKKFLLAGVCATPFLFFAYHLNVRSFALLSLIPLSIIYFFQHAKTERRFSAGSLRLFVKGLPIILALVATSMFVTYEKQSRLRGVPEQGQLTGMPDAGLVYGAGLIFATELNGYTNVEFNSLRKYLANIASPFIKLYSKLFSFKEKPIEDTPVVMARIIDGVPKNYEIYHHYPVLWYSDAVLSFGHYGVLFGILWGVVAAIWERLLRISWMVTSILLPFYCWHMYMLVRGAIAVAAAPISYALYVALLVFIIAFALPNTLRREKAPIRSELVQDGTVQDKFPGLMR